MEALPGFLLAGVALAGSPGPATLSLAAAAAAFGPARVTGYFIGIALGMVAVMAITASGVVGLVLAGDPPASAVVVLALFGAIGAMLLQRHVIIVSTAFGGAWTAIVGALAFQDGVAVRASNMSDVWILYPMSPAPGKQWVPVAWVALGLLGTGVQLAITGRKRP